MSLWNLNHFSSRNSPDFNFIKAGDSRASGYVDFSFSPFQIANLLDGDALTSAKLLETILNHSVKGAE